jgi:CubicO group peptidase (beta-lactamase class C family)
VGLETGIGQAVAETSFSGVVRVDRDGELTFANAYGFAHRAFEIPNTVETRFGIASGAKGFTALTVMSLVEEGTLGLATTARSLLGDDLPLIDDRVTVEHLLAHSSGIGDYFDEEIERPITDYVLPVPMQELDTIEGYLRVLDGYPMKFTPGERFTYCNGGYVVLALLAERASGRSFHELVVERVCVPARMPDTAFLRSDELPERTALGYLDATGNRTNVFHLPVRGSGDGGIYSTAADIRGLWTALFDGRIVPEERVAEMVRPHSDAPAQQARYGLGFWLHASLDVVELQGYDAGVSFRSVHDPNAGLTHTVISNTSEGAWRISELLDEALLPAPGAQ